MNTPELTMRPFPQGTLAYELRVGGARLGHQWTLDHGVDADGLRRRELLLELDLSALGQGGAPVTARGELVCDARGRPVMYHSESSGRRLTLRFADGRVTATLPDGETLAVDDVPGDCAVLDANLVGLTALAVAGARAPAEMRGQALIASQLLVIPYATTRAPELDRDGLSGYRSSLREELWLAPDGALVELAMPAQGACARRVEPAPPLPAWAPAGPPVPAPPEYARPPGSVARLEDVTIVGPVTPIGGALTLPPGPTRAPAALFLGGSGRHDRHGMTSEIDIGSHELLDGLGERGFVTLRCDSRGAGTTRVGSDALDRGVEALLRDAEACLDYLCARPEVAPGGVFVIGHSEGGLLALALAERRPADVRGLVLLATPGRPIAAVMAEQIEVFGRLRGLSPAQVEQQIADLRAFVAAAGDAEAWTGDRVPPHLRAGARSRRWLAEHAQRSGEVAIARVRVPVLLCQGGKDLQVSPERDASRLRAAAEAAGVPLEYAYFPDLDHLFKPVEGAPDPRQYYVRARRLDPAVVARVADWLQVAADT